MAQLEAGSGRTSPSSGRASPSPVSRKRTLFLGDEPLSKDKAYRRYASGVDRSLALFDSALEEWADYISFLGRLLKSLQAHPATIVAVPSKAIVAKRLAQCLNPSLPSGVHHKALEVYAYIFSMIGKDSLSRDLPLYLPGLSTTLSFASLSVRTPFLQLVEKHLLRLDSRSLRPALKAIILALLPGLEEETSEEFERTLRLFAGFRTAVRLEHSEEPRQNHSSGDEYFWQCFFLATITSSSRRSGALAYLTRNLPSLGQTLSQEAASNGSQRGNGGAESLDTLAGTVTSPEPGLLLRCFAAGLTDEQLLIQRGFLDLLVTHLPLHANVLQKRVKIEDLELLIKAAAGVVTRRDMSLNRRLWTWLLGPEQDIDGPESPTSVTGDPLAGHSSSRTRYFEEFGLQPLTNALINMINCDALNPLERARPFRICLSLMDRWEIGGLLVPDIFLPVVNSVRRYKNEAATKADFNEVLRSASVFFDGVESGLIWGEVVGLIAQALGAGQLSPSERMDKLSLANFIVGHFNVREEEMLLIHAPLTTLTLLVMIDDAKAKMQSEISAISYQVSRLALSIAVELVELIPERAFQIRPSTSESTVVPREDASSLLSNPQTLRLITTFYMRDQGNLDAYPSPISSRDICELLIREGGKITCHSLSDSVSSADAELKSRLLVSILAKVPKASSLDTTTLLGSMYTRLKLPPQLPFLVFASITSLAASLYSTSYITAVDLSGLVDPLVRQAWSYLSASHPKYHVETVRCLWHLQSTLPLSSHEVEASICTLMAEKDITGTFAVRDADPGRRFSTLWIHTIQDNAGHLERRPSKVPPAEKGLDRVSGTCDYEIMLARPLLLFLDALLDERTQLFMTVRTWLQSLVGIDKVFHIFVAKFSSFEFLRTASENNSRFLDSQDQMYTDEDDLDQCLYYLRTLSNVLRWSSEGVWAALVENSISTDAIHSSLHRITGRDGEVTLLEFFLHVCLRAVSGNRDAQTSHLVTRIGQFHRAALTTLHQILLSPYSLPLAELQLEHVLIDRLSQSLGDPDPFIQALLLDVIFASLKIRNSSQAIVPPTSPAIADFKRSMAQETSSGPPPSTIDRFENGSIGLPTPPASLVKCLQAGFAAPSSRSVLDSWVSFLTECLPLYSESIFQILIPLVETLCFEVGQTFSSLQRTFKDPGSALESTAAPESTLISLLNGLEQVLAKGHDRLLQDEVKMPVVKSPDQPQGFFGNMVSGVFTSETPQARSVTANHRLTVLLSFQDAVRICFEIWSWGGHDGNSQDVDSAASFNYTSLRMRNRARRLLEHLFAAETLECLETVVEVWQKSSRSQTTRSSVVFNLLHVLDGSRPKHTIPAIFNAIYSRTNPTALDPARKSTLTSSLKDIDLVVFLVEYAKSLDDDAMDEIWTDCMTFLKDLLANPFPHRQTLPSLLEFAAILGEKVDNTNFGEQRRMRRELGDLFLRMLTAIFTTRPMAFAENATDNEDRATMRSPVKSDDVIGILASIAPNLPKILVEPDRILSAANTISMSVISPIFKSKSFPDNISKSSLVLLYQVARLPNTQKSWRKDLGDAFNDPRFFGNSVTLVESDWLPLMRQWILSDKERMPELLSRLTTPTTAGIVFGVGATSARLEADRKAQLNLRRAATLILATVSDNFVSDLPVMQEKLVDLLSATTTSSPSATIRADIYILLRALVLKTSAVHLADLWPTINAELHHAINSVVAPDHSLPAETYNNYAILQACKLLDTLLCIAPDDFQLHEWLFITDTIDAVYRHPNFHPIALVDELSEELGLTALSSAVQTESLTAQASQGSKRKPLIGLGGISDEGSWERKEDLVGKVLRPFFSQLSIFAFESTYSMSMPDWDACRMGLLKDLFDERSIVKAL